MTSVSFMFLPPDPDITIIRSRRAPPTSPLKGLLKPSPPIPRRSSLPPFLQSLYRAPLALPHPNQGVSPRIRGGVPGVVPGSRTLLRVLYADASGICRPRAQSLRALLRDRRLRRCRAPRRAPPAAPRGQKKSPKVNKTKINNDAKRSYPILTGVIPDRYRVATRRPRKQWRGKPLTSLWDVCETSPQMPEPTALEIVPKKTVVAQPSSTVFYDFPASTEINQPGIPKNKDRWTLDLKVTSFGDLVRTATDIIRRHRPGYTTLYTCFSSKWGRVFTRVGTDGRLFLLCDAYKSNCVFPFSAPAFLAHYLYCNGKGPFSPLAVFFPARNSKEGFCYLKHMYECALRLGAPFFLRRSLLGEFPSFATVMERLKLIYGESDCFRFIRGDMRGRVFHCDFSSGLKTITDNCRVGGSKFALITAADGTDFDVPAYGLINPRLSFAAFGAVSPFRGHRYVRTTHLHEKDLVRALDYVVRYIRRYTPGAMMLYTRFINGPYCINLHPSKAGRIGLEVRCDRKFFSCGEICSTTYVNHFNSVFRDGRCVLYERDFPNGLCYLKHIFHLCVVSGSRFDEKHATQRLGRFPTAARLRWYCSRFFGAHSLSWPVHGTFTSRETFHVSMLTKNFVNLRDVKQYFRIGGEHLTTDVDKMKVVNIAFSKAAEAKDSILTKSIEKHVIDFHQDFEAIQKSKTKSVVNFLLTDSQQVALSRAYPEFNISFTHSTLSAHPMAAASRALENDLLHKWVKRDYTDIGGCLKMHVSKGHNSVHVCRPVYDPKDAQRREQRLLEYALIDPINTDDEHMLEAVKTCSSCCSLVENCDVQSKFIVAIQVYDLPLLKLCQAMINKNSTIAYITMITPGELIDLRRNFLIPTLECEVAVNPAMNSISYAFGSSVYTHQLSTITEYMKTPYVVIAENLFSIEMICVRCEVNYYKIVRSQYCPRLSGVKTLRYKRADSGITRVRLPVFDAKLKTCTNKNEYIYVETKFISQVYEYIVNTCSQINSKTFEWAWNYVKCSKSRVVISGKVIHRDVSIPLANMEAFVAVMLAAGVRARLSAEYFSKKLAFISGDASYYDMIKYAISEKMKSILAVVNTRVTAYLKAILSDTFDIQFLTDERCFEEVSEYAEHNASYQLEQFGSVKDNEEMNTIVNSITDRITLRKISRAEKEITQKEHREWIEDKKNSEVENTEDAPLLGNKREKSNTYKPPHSRGGGLRGGASCINTFALLKLFSGYTRKIFEVLYNFCCKSTGLSISQRDFISYGEKLVKFVGSALAVNLVVALVKLLFLMTRQNVCSLLQSFLDIALEIRTKVASASRDIEVFVILALDLCRQKFSSAKEKVVELRDVIFSKFNHGEWKEVLVESISISVALVAFDYYRYIVGEISLLELSIKWVAKAFTMGCVSHQLNHIGGESTTLLEWHFKQMVAYITASVVLPSTATKIEKVITVSCAIPAIVRLLLCSFLPEDDGGTYVGYVNHGLSVNPVVSFLTLKAKQYGLSVKAYIRDVVDKVCGCVGEALVTSVKDATGVTHISHAVSYVKGKLWNALPNFIAASHDDSKDEDVNEEFYDSTSSCEGLKGGSKTFSANYVVSKIRYLFSSKFQEIKNNVNIWFLERERLRLRNEVLREINYLTTNGSFSSYELTKFVNNFQVDEQVMHAVKELFGDETTSLDVRELADAAAVIVYLVAKRRNNSWYNRIINFFSKCGRRVAALVLKCVQIAANYLRKYTRTAPCVNKCDENAISPIPQVLHSDECFSISEIEISNDFVETLEVCSVDPDTFEITIEKGGLKGGGNDFFKSLAIDLIHFILSGVRIGADVWHSAVASIRSLKEKFMQFKIFARKKYFDTLEWLIGKLGIVQKPGLRGGGVSLFRVLLTLMRKLPKKFLFQTLLVILEIYFPASLGARLATSLIFVRRTTLTIKILKYVLEHAADVIIFALHSQYIPENVKLVIEDLLFSFDRHYYLVQKVNAFFTKTQKYFWFMKTTPGRHQEEVPSTHVTAIHLEDDIITILDDIEMKKNDFIDSRDVFLRSEKKAKEESRFVRETLRADDIQPIDVIKDNASSDVCKGKEAVISPKVSKKETRKWSEIESDDECDILETPKECVDSDRADLIPAIMKNFKDSRRPSVASSSKETVSDDTTTRQIGMSKFLTQLNTNQDVPMQPTIDYTKGKARFTNSMRDFYYTQRVALFELYTNLHDKFLELEACGFNPMLTSFRQDSDYIVWDNIQKKEYTKGTKTTLKSTSHIWLTYDFVFCRDGLVFSENAEKYDYCIYGESLKFLSPNAFLFKQPNPLVTFNNIDVELLVYEAPPGGGKTYTLLEVFLAKIKKLDIFVLTANRNSSDEIKKKVVKNADKKLFSPDQVKRLQSRVMTVDSYLINKYNRKCQVLFIDECFMVHAGAILTCLEATGCKAAVFFGDSRQIHYIHRNDYGNSLETMYDLDKFIKDSCKMPGLNSYRCPNDVCLWLSKEYGHKIESKNKYVDPESKTMSITEIDEVGDVKYVEGVKYLTYTQSEKRDLQNALIKKHNDKLTKPPVVNTVHEVQGDTFEKVFLVRCKYQEEGPFSSKNHIIVALSRHTHELKYNVIRGRSYDDTASCIRLAQTLCDEFRNNFYGQSSELDWELQSFPENFKNAKAVSSPFQSINNFLEEVIPGTTQISLGNLSAELNTQPFECTVDGVVIQDSNSGRNNAAPGIQRV
ncbi:polyprotein 1a [Fig virus B]|uniref:Polyprotein n=1 Tax=Fig closterovirus 1 TaxID=2809010 RepID=A0A8A0XU91_9CLOS|nr:polyprotein 1a [Fig virus B]QSQ86321.1 polyprotein [Fig closterovirus 1]